MDCCFTNPTINRTKNFFDIFMFYAMKNTLCSSEHYYLYRPSIAGNNIKLNHRHRPHHYTRYGKGCKWSSFNVCHTPAHKIFSKSLPSCYFITILIESSDKGFTIIYFASICVQCRRFYRIQRTMVFCKCIGHLKWHINK